MDISAQFLGLKISSPIVAGSCGLTNNLDNLKRLEDAGVGAVVLQSVFEEEILHNAKRIAQGSAHVDSYGEGYDYASNHESERALETHFNLARQAKESLSIPVVASINCYSFNTWINYIEGFREAGCDAVELNMGIVPCELNVGTADVERLYHNIILSSRRATSLPISVKVSYYFTDLAQFMQQISWSGIAGITMFNRSALIDIDTENLEFKQSPLFSTSTSDAFHNILHWMAVLSGKLRCPISASTGIMTSEDVVKALLAGAGTTQLMATLYRNGLGYVKDINAGLVRWMEQHDFSSIDQFRGRLAIRKEGEAQAMTRSQFMRFYSEM
ncbi:MAG: dihydroorotate dehydrogenase-like protein [Bacteroidales bacterium]|nr:dihydroorotate dehydrogenase-like protein [Candidatus Colimorpha onthohippi]